MCPKDSNILKNGTLYEIYAGYDGIIIVRWIIKTSMKHFVK